MPSPASTEAVLTIDLPAIVANWKDMAARGAPGAVAGVVKADGYGLGATEVGRALRAAGCRHFFVAQLREGIALREAIGPGPMIAVLGGFRPGEDGDAALTPVLNSLGDVAAHGATGRADGVARRAILHVDTAMARLGLDERELQRVSQDHGLLAGLDLLYVMTHLACADEPAHPLNAAQAKRFAAACDGLPKTRRCFANSSGMFLGPAFASDLSRPGCALYGINPTPGQDNPMRQVARLDAPVLQIREIAPGTPVGYGASWTAERPTRVATVAVGYADGYLRSLSSRAAAEFRGRKVPLIGRVSMDLTTFDVTDLPEISPGDRLTLVGGAGCSPDDLAAAAGTIGYEILTSLGARYHRDYIRG